MKDDKQVSSLRKLFDKFANKATKATGSPVAFILAVLIVVVWAVCGPIFSYSETWQLVINTGTTIITFLMVFIIQQSQNKDTIALHMKLNELIAATKTASNRLIDVEDLTEKELETIKTYYVKLSELAKKENDIHATHSLDEAEENDEEKRAQRQG
ncbi:MAG: low affinity iron permease family protein [Sphingobacteriales bacterium]|nr:MAG: low affinity iron permease family protein [Sphingobacteriales bacterium]